MKKSYKGILLFLMILAIITLSFSFVSASENVTSDVILDDVSSQGEIDEIDDGYDDSAEKLRRTVLAINRETAKFFFQCLIELIL